jgi:uncharacterized protein Usg
VPLRFSWCLWFRLYTHALLLESRIFTNIELCDEFLGSMPTGFTDIWKGKYHGELVCIKAIQTRDLFCLREIKRVRGSFPPSEAYSLRLCQTFRREINGCKSISHPNVLPIIEISETLFPCCLMSPWMPDGNIIQYTQTNPGIDRLMLVCPHQPEDW